MQSNISEKIKPFFFWGFGLVAIASILAGLYLKNYALMAIPFILVFGFISLADIKPTYYLLLFTLPLSTEVMIGNFGTDLPSEPLMVILMFMYVIQVLLHPKTFEDKFFTHPIILFLLLHYVWIFFTALHSYNFVVSIKFFLAKTWYIVTFLLLTPVIINSVERMKYFFWLMFIPLTFTSIQAIIRYYSFGFDFEFVNDTMPPFFRNHVSYGAMLTSFFPFIFLARSWYNKGSLTRILLSFSIIFYIVAIYLSYTRMCYIALVVAAGAYFIIKLNKMKWALAAAVIVVAISLSYFIKNNNYLRLSPQFEKTITHDNFEDLLEATVSMEDASSMERLYRWVAAFHMYNESPYLGHGPGNFYPFYKSYTVTEFTTYLSDNDEQSTVHNYFLLLLVEQGIIGLGIFLFFALVLFIWGEKLYHACINENNKRIILACLLSLVTAFVNLMFNDMIEADKTGSLFFICIGLLVAFGIKEEKSLMKATA
jgi:O-antigen ligase